MVSIGDKYSKWDQYVDSDDEHLGPGGLDLDALKGSDAAEIAQIQKNWGNTTNTTTTTTTPTTTTPTPTSTPPTTTPLKQTAQSTKPQPSPFSEWDKYDAEKAILELENEDRHDPEEAPTMMRAENGRVAVETVDYKKDAEEHRVDVEFEEKAKDLKQTVARKFRDAHVYKEEGNALMKRGKCAEAAVQYAKGTLLIEYCVEVLVLAAPSMQEKITSLATALHSNHAQATLAAGDYTSAANSAAEALRLTPSHEKSLYRRASAFAHLGKVKEALEDLNALPEGNTAAQKLKVTLLAGCEA